MKTFIGMSVVVSGMLVSNFINTTVLCKIHRKPLFISVYYMYYLQCFSLLTVIENRIYKLPYMLSVSH